METYFESAEDITISRKRALQELKKHCLFTGSLSQAKAQIAEFNESCGLRKEYDAQSVLLWLGY